MRYVKFICPHCGGECIDNADYWKKAIFGKIKSCAGKHGLCEHCNEEIYSAKLIEFSK